MKNSIITLIIAVVCLPLSIIAQDSNTDNHIVKIIIPHVALLDIEPAASHDIDLEATAPTEAGDPLTFTDTDNTLWMNYSVIRNSAGATKKVLVKIDALVPGVDLKLAVGNYTGTGLGNKGTGVAGPTTLTTTDQEAVTGIGSCYTVTGANNGHQLTYSFGLTTGNYGDLQEQATDVTVTYTLINN